MFGAHERILSGLLVLAGAAILWLLRRRRAGDHPEFASREYDFASLVSSLSDSVVIVDQAGAIRGWNRAAERTVGYTSREMIGQPATPLLGEASRQMLVLHLEQLRTTGRSEFVDTPIEVELVRKDGSTFPAQVIATVWRQGGEFLTGAIIRDLSERLESEAQLKRLALAVEQAHEAIVITDPDSRIEYVNPAFERTTGYSRSEAVGKRPSILKSGEQDEAFYQDLWETLARGEVWSGTFVNRRKDGTLYEESGTISPVRDVAGRTLHYVAVKSDITRERALERQLRLKEATVDHAVDGVFWIRPDARFLDVNPSACSRLGYSRDELLKLSVPDIDPDVSPGVWKGLFETLRSEGSLHLETRHRTRDGRLLPVELTANLISFEGQEYVCAFARDITERRRHETERAEHQRELEHRNQELDAFAYVASHDLKAPLRAIGNLAKWIEEDAKDRLTGESRRHLDTLTQRVQRMEGLLEDMLKYSRAGRQGGEPEDVRTASLVAEIVDMIAPPASFEVQVSPDLPHLRTPKAPLRQVFLNLIANAVKHHDRPAGTITVSARDAGELVEFAVADDGPGIPTEFQERVFGMFQTLKPRDEVEGSGMGLAVIRKVVELQRGRVTLESEGRGATFRFTWPKQPASRAAESADLVGSA